MQTCDNKTKAQVGRPGIPPIYAIGHSTRPISVFLGVSYGIIDKVTTVKIAEVREGQQHIDVTGEVVESSESYERFMGLDFGTFEPVTYMLRDVVIKDETGSISRPCA